MAAEATQSQLTSKTTTGPILSLDLEGQQIPVLIKTMFKLQWPDVAKFFRLLYIDIASDFAGKHETLAKQLEEYHQRVGKMQAFLMGRTDFCTTEEEEIWIDEVVDKMWHTIERHGLEFRKSGEDLETIPPCGHQYDIESGIIKWKPKKWRVLHILMSKYSCSDLEVAAVVTALFKDAPVCHRIACDGLANYLLESYQREKPTLQQIKISPEQLAYAQIEIEAPAYRLDVSSRVLRSSRRQTSRGFLSSCRLSRIRKSEAQSCRTPGGRKSSIAGIKRR